MGDTGVGAPVKRNIMHAPARRNIWLSCVHALGRSSFYSVGLISRRAVLPVRRALRRHPLPTHPSTYLPPTPLAQPPAAFLPRLDSVNPP